MNKTKRNIIQLRANLVRKLASQIKPFKLSERWLNVWYTENAKTPLQVNSEVLKLKKSKLNKIYHKLSNYNTSLNYVSGSYNFGNSWVVKFPMITFICSIDVDNARQHYNNFIESFKPVVHSKTKLNTTMQSL